MRMAKECKMSEWKRLVIGNLPEELTKNYDVKSIKIGDNEKIFYRKLEPKSSKEKK